MSYTKKTWQANDEITATALNNIENELNVLGNRQIISNSTSSTKITTANIDTLFGGASISLAKGIYIITARVTIKSSGSSSDPRNVEIAILDSDSSAITYQRLTTGNDSPVSLTTSCLYEVTTATETITVAKSSNRTENAGGATVIQAIRIS